jgi:hypothetical protein
MFPLVDIHTDTMTMSRFQTALQKQHLEVFQQMYGVLRKLKSAAICICTENTDFSELPDHKYDRCEIVYGHVTEEVPKDLPKYLCNRVTTVSYGDANPQQDLLTGCYVSGSLHFYNQTVADWYSKFSVCVQTSDSHIWF